MTHAKQFILFFGAILTTSVGVRAFAQSAEEQAVLASIHAMFDGMSKRDATAIKAPTLSGGTMVLMRAGKPTQMTLDAFAERVGKLVRPRLKNAFTMCDLRKQHRQADAAKIIYF